MSELPGRFATNTHPEYELIQELGRGANGVVFEALQRGSKRRVALKLLLASGAEDPNHVARFTREGRALAQLDHPGIAKLYSFDSEEGTPWMAMELIQGRDLGVVVKERCRLGEAFSIDRGFKWFRELAEILEYGRQTGIIHRDLKPSNIIIEKETERLVLVDFGLLKRTQSLLNSQSKLTETGEVIGTPSFMSPEQIDGSFGKLSSKTDVWALGATMFFCATGAPPFERKSIPALCIAIMTNDAPRLTLGTSTEELKYVELVARCLSKKAQDRPAPHELILALSEEKDANAPSRLPLLALASVSLLVLLSVFIVFWSQRTLKAELTRLDLPDFIVENSVPLKGQINPPTARVRLNGEDLPLNEKGVFSIRCKVAKAKREASIELNYWNGSEWTSLTKKSVKRAPLPKLTVEGPDWRIYRRRAPILRGTISGETARLLINGEEVKTEQGAFQYKIPRGFTETTVVARTISGDQVTKTIECVLPKNFAQRTRILFDRKQWQRAEEKAQDIALAIVALELKAQWTFKGANVWTCGGQSHRVGTYVHKASKIEFQLIPGGRFLMGSSAEDIESHRAFGQDFRTSYKDKQGKVYVLPYGNEQPQHLVELKPFLMAAFETSREEWSRIVRTYRSLGDLPVKELSHMIVKANLARDKVGLRLPTEAEWEYACRAGTRTRFFWGDEVDARYLWFSGNSKRVRSTRAHSQFRNAFGLADMSGNVWELCEDYYWRDYSLAPTDGSAVLKVDPRGPWPIQRRGPLVVRRGGRNTSLAGACRSTRRYHVEVSDPHKGTGFRLACSLPKID